MRKALGLGVLVLLASTSLAPAGGLILYEAGTPDVGYASAGWAARAEDAATILTNPAGMTRLKENDLLLGVQALYASVQFTPNSLTSTTGSDGGNPVGWFPGGGFFYVNPTTDHLRLGVAATGNFGLGLEYRDDWVGRYYVQKGTTLGLSVLPSIAWKFNDRFSLGASLNAMYGVFETRVAVNNTLPLLPPQKDGSLKMEDTTWGFGGNLGMLFEPSEKTRFGFTYTSKVRLDFSDTPQFTDLSPAMTTILQAAGLLGSRVDLSMTVPQTFMASFVHRVDDRWSLLGNAGWQDWSAFGKVDVMVDSDTPASLTVTRNFKDTWQLAAGAQMKTASPWSVTFGAAYDSSCLDDADRAPTLPVGAAWRLGAGGRRPLSQNLDLGIAYELAWGGNMPMDQRRGPLAGRVAGAYNDSAMHFFAASLRWKL